MSIHRPTTTAFPDELLDYWLGSDEEPKVTTSRQGEKRLQLVRKPRLTDQELRCLCYIVRHTFGYRKSGDALSLNQFHKGIKKRADGTKQDDGCGVPSRANIAKALKSLEAKGLIKRTVHTVIDGAERNDVTLYALDMDETPPPASRNGTGGSTCEILPPADGVVSVGYQGSTCEIQGVVSVGYQGSTCEIHTTDNRQQTKIQQTRDKTTTRPPSSSSPRSPCSSQEWTTPLITRIEGALTCCALEPDHEERLRELLSRLLSKESPAMRVRFVDYVLSTDYLSHTEIPGAVVRVLEEDYAHWVKQRKPASKHVSAHVVKEARYRHEPVMKGPADHLALAESIRRHKGDDSADKYLREHGLLRTDGT